jgi:predicted RNA-binding protein with TRAM domain
MLFTRTPGWAIALLLLAGCGGSKSATLVQGDEKQITVRIIAKTGDGLDAPIEQKVRSGTVVTILDDSTSGSTVRVRIEQGDLKGQEATVARKAIRRPE